MTKIKLKKNKKLSAINKIIILVISLVILISFTFRYISKKVSPILIDYAQSYITKITNLIINKAISKQLSEELNVEDLFIITKDSSGYIKTIDFNPSLVNKALTIITNNIQMNLKYLEEGNSSLLEIPDLEIDEKKLKKGIIYEVPTGVIFNNVLLTNLGPKVPVKLDIIGDIISTINTKITNYGINNALMEVSVFVSVEEMVLLPISSKKIRVEASIPIAIKLIEGVVPNYYFNGMDKNSPSLALPSA